jgi:HK97 family phage portal protein
MLPINIVKYEGFDKRIVKTNLSELLNLKPDGNHTKYIFLKQLVESVILRGNGYAYIKRDDQLNVIGLQYLNPDFVTPMPQKDGTMKYLVAGMSAAVDAVNMIHLYMHCDEQGNGISLIKYAANTLDSNTSAEKQAQNYFSNGGSLNGILQASATLTKEQKGQIKDSWNQAFTGEGRTGVAILPQGLEYKPISVNPADQQLLESREFGVVEIARWFCIPPSKLMLWDDVSYNALEYSQLVYLTDTIQPYVEMIANEFNTKLFKPSQIGKMGVEFDFTRLLITDNTSKVKYYGDMVKNGLMSPNEARLQLGFEKIPAELGGDDYYMQLSYSTLKNIASGAMIKGQQQSQVQAVDNQAKEKED